MGWLWVIFALGFWPLLMLIVLSIGVVLYLTGAVGLDGLFAASQTQGTLVCWHCQQETSAGRRRCSHCGGELQ